MRGSRDLLVGKVLAAAQSRVRRPRRTCQLTAYFVTRTTLSTRRITVTPRRATPGLPPTSISTSRISS